MVGMGRPDSSASWLIDISPPPAASASSRWKARSRVWTPPRRPASAASSSPFFRIVETYGIVVLLECRRLRLTSVVQKVASAIRNRFRAAARSRGRYVRSDRRSCLKITSRRGTMADLKVTGEAVDRGEEILTPQALGFVADLQQTFGPRRDELLARRADRRAEIASTGRLDFLPSAKQIREADWTVGSAPADLVDRRVEITGPTERKMAINALNSGARV